MTIKWVQVDPLVMNGEPFCYGSRLTVRQLLEMRRSGYDLPRILTDNPELRWLGIAFAYCYAADHPERYAEFLAPDVLRRGPSRALRGVPGARRIVDRARLQRSGGGRPARRAAPAGRRRRCWSHGPHL